MFDIGWTELLVIAVVAIIIVGPKDLPAMLRTLGRYAGKLKRTAGEFREQFDDALRDSELDELRSTVSEMGDLNPVNQIRDSVTESLEPLKDAASDITSGIEDIGSSGSGGGEAAKATDASASSPETKEAPKPSRGKKAQAKAAPRKKAAKKPAAGKKPADAGAAKSEG